MKQPIPRNGTEPLKFGDQVQIVPEWQDPGDDQFESFVIEAPPDCTRVRIRTILPNLIIHPTSSSTQPHHPPNRVDRSRQAHPHPT